MPDVPRDRERADPVVPGQAPRGMVDADDFLAFAERLRATHRRVDEAAVSEDRRARWARKLVAITELGRDDLDRAQEQLARFEHELERHLDG